jgi:hypothetical protein
MMKEFGKNMSDPNSRSLPSSTRSVGMPFSQTPLFLAMALVALVVWPPASRAVDTRNHDFVLGYATAVVERAEFQQAFVIDFEAGVVRVDFTESPDTPFDSLVRALLEVEGVQEVEIYVDGILADQSTPIGDSLSSTEIQTEGPPGEDYADAVRDGADHYEFFSLGELFDPILADPRWPRFSVAYQEYIQNDELERVGSATFGETFSIVRSPRHDWGQWEVGFQAGVFSVFDLEASSSDLVNTDFLVGLTASYHFGDFTSILRFYHQSSHLGDEYLLRTQVNRVNLSFEVLDVLVSYERWQWLRLYGGGGVLVHREPALDRGILQAGIELHSPRAYVGGFLRPIAGADFQFRQESDWKQDVSIRSGVQIEHPFLRRTQMQILAEFYSGRSPNGQFYDRRIETIGIGLYLSI